MPAALVALPARLLGGKDPILWRRPKALLQVHFSRVTKFLNLHRGGGPSGAFEPFSPHAATDGILG
jgi:hypothetical protein